jgi:hypothetical protein
VVLCPEISTTIGRLVRTYTRSHPNMSSEFDIAVTYILNNYPAFSVEKPKAQDSQISSLTISSKVKEPTPKEAMTPVTRGCNPGPPQYNGDILDNLDHVWAEVCELLVCVFNS